jgi:hypothetical protein
LAAVAPVQRGCQVAWAVGSTLLALALCTSPAAHAQAQGGKAEGPDMSIGVDKFPGEDAVILRWEQHWTLEKDGAVRRRDHKWLKLLNRLPIRAVADPRLDYCVGQDELEIHTAVTHLPNGSVLPVADYSFNKTGPDDVAGWPEYTAWEQTVICFGGIEDNCVLELDYEIVTGPGFIPWLEADLCLHQDYPVVERVIQVTVPAGVKLYSQVDRATPEGDGFEESRQDDLTTYRWTFKNLPGAPAEPQSPPWQKRCGRLRFTTCAGAAEWVSAFAKPVDAASQSDEAIKKFAQAVIEHEADPREQVRKIAKKLHDSFSFVNSSKTMRSFDCRKAAEVLRSNYGSPLESAALLAAALRALEMDTSVQVAVEADSWNAEVPMRSAFAGVVVIVDLPDGPVRVHPQHGVFDDPGHWGRHWLLGIGPGDRLRAAYVRARGEKRPSEIQISGKIILDKTGKATGDLRIRLTGAFYDPRRLEDAGEQKSLIKGLLGRVLSEFQITDHSVATLSADVLKATVTVASKEELKSFDKERLLHLGSGPAFLPDFPMPLGRSQRKTDVQLAGRFSERVDLTIELPEGWQAAILPASMARAEGSWGSAQQTVEVDGRTVRFHRVIVTTTTTLAPNDFDSLREVVNSLRTEASRVLVAEPAAKDSEPAVEVSAPGARDAEVATN